MTVSFIREQKQVKLGKILVKENIMKLQIMKCLNDLIKIIHLKTKNFIQKIILTKKLIYLLLKIHI